MAMKQGENIMEGSYLQNVMLIEQKLRREQDRARKPDVESDEVRHFLPLELLRNLIKRPE